MKVFLDSPLGALLLASAIAVFGVVLPLIILGNLFHG